MRTLLHDMRYGFRLLLKQPGFTAVAVLAIALGIGANSAIFSVVNGVLLRALPYSEPERLVMLWEQHPQSGRMGVAGANFVEWQRRSSSFEALTLFAQTGYDLTGEGEAERVRGMRVSADYFRVIGGQPALGRTFLPNEDARGAERVAVVSHEFWRQRLGAARSLGQTIQLSGESYEVVGVTPPDFGDVRGDYVWTPLYPEADGLVGGGRSYQVLARLKPDITLGQAQTEMDSTAAGLAEERPQFNRDWGVRVVPLHEQLVGGVRLPLLVLSAAVGFVLLIACANVANLSLARAARRRREFAVRSALGATRWRIIRQVLTENVMLALAGGGLGLLLALWGVDFLLALAPGDIPRATEVGVDSSVLVFTLAVSLVTGVAFGLAPALQNSRGDVSGALKEEARSSAAGFGRSRLRGALVVAEVALAVVLLTGAGLLLRSFAHLTRVDPGFDAEHVLLLEVPLNAQRYKEDAQVAQFYEEMIGRVRALPGVEAAGTTHVLPLTGMDSVRPFIAADAATPEPGKEPGASYRIVSPGYFRAMGIPVLAGREFADIDQPTSTGVALINQTMARRYFGGEAEALGRRMRQGAVSSETPWLEVVGVVGDVRHAGLDSEPKPEMYFAHAQVPIQQSRSISANSRNFTLAIRTKGDPVALGAAARREVASIDKNQPVTGVRTLTESVARSVTPQRFQTLLLVLFAGLAVSLAVIGVYGVMSYTVGGRTREIGVRIALGAQTRDIVRMIVGQGMALVCAGVALGVAASLAATRVLAGLLYGVSTTDPLVFVATPSLLAAVALLACYLPARRATKVNPMTALRSE